MTRSVDDAGKADRPSAELRRGPPARGSVLETITRPLCWIPAACATRAASLDYLRSLKAKPQIFAWSEAEPLSALGATDKLLVGEVAHELASRPTTKYWPTQPARNGNRRRRAGVGGVRDAHLAWRLMLAPHLGDAVKPKSKKKLWRPAQLGQVWTAKKGALSVDATEI